MVGGSLLMFPFHSHGTLSANFVGRFKLPVAATLKEVQFSCAGATAATLEFGTAADPDGIMTAGAVGQSGAVNTLTNSNFNGALYTAVDPLGTDIENMAFPEDTVFNFTVTHASAVNLDLNFVFEV